MEAICTTETLVNTYKIARSPNPEDHNERIHCRISQSPRVTSCILSLFLNTSFTDNILCCDILGFHGGKLKMTASWDLSHVVL
jgi:hypothetical protein